MDLKTELAGQRYSARAATIACSISLFIGVYQTIAFAIAGNLSLSLCFIVSSIAQVFGLLAAQRPSNSLRAPLMAFLFMWASFIAAVLITTITLSEWMFLTTLSVYFVLPVNKANLLNVIVWGLFTLVSPELFTVFYIDLAVAVGILLLANVAVSQIHSLEAELAKSHVTDLVTGCANRQSLSEEMSKAIEMNRRYKTNTTALSLHVLSWPLWIEEKGFEQANALLSQLVQVWMSRLRNTDCLCRYNDDQFICLLPNTSTENAGLLSKDLNMASSEYEFADDVSIDLTIRIANSADFEDWEAWLHSALN